MNKEDSQLVPSTIPAFSITNRLASLAVALSNKEINTNLPYWVSEICFLPSIEHLLK